MRAVFHKKSLLGLLIVKLGSLWHPTNLCAQDIKSKPKLSEELWDSPRGLGMSGALTGLADGTDAPLYNPAGIGGLNEKPNQPFVRSFQFPTFGLSANPDFSKFQKSQGKTALDAEGNLKAAAEGERQYGRATFFPNLGFDTLNLGYLADAQVLAQAEDQEVDFLSRAQSGPTFGLSTSDRKNRFFLGLFGARLQRIEASGRAPASELDSIEERAALVKKSKKTYYGDAVNAGFIWIMEPKYRSSLSFAAQNVGSTRYTSTRSTPDENGSYEDHKNIPQNSQIGLSVSPQLGRWGWFSTNLGANHLHDPSKEGQRKLMVGAELSLGEGYGHDSIGAVRVGGTYAGASYGFGLNLGLLEIQYANYPVDLSSTESKQVERRQSATVSINLID